MKNELLSTVRSIVGAEFSDMDIIRALHLANHDPTAAINIIFDTPNFKTPEKKSTPTRPKLLISKENVTPPLSENCTVGNAVVEDSSENVIRTEGSEWWFVGRGDVAGMSTCKGRKVRRGDEVVFAFPTKSSNSKLPSKNFGRARQAVVACSEIVRFSTKSSGEVKL